MCCIVRYVAKRAEFSSQFTFDGSVNKESMLGISLQTLFAMRSTESVVYQCGSILVMMSYSLSSARENKAECSVHLCIGFDRHCEYHCHYGVELTFLSTVELHFDIHIHSIFI